MREKIDGVLFIDANQYLDLYSKKGTERKKLLKALTKLQGYIFVTTQIVDEVQRNKVKKAAEIVRGLKEQQDHIVVITQVVDEALASKLRKVLEEQLKCVQNLSVPDLLVTTADQEALVKEINERLRTARKEIAAANREKHKVLMNLASDLLRQIIRSEDEVSKALAGIFAKAAAHKDDELERARARKERGNPPGKNTDPLGDQLSWEQLLSHQVKQKGRLWIITGDKDYATKYGDDLFLNAALYQDLARLKERLGQPAPEVSCFDDIAKGINDFAEKLHLKVEKLPTQETEQIKKEQEALPPIGWGVWNPTIITSRTGVLGFGGGQPIIETQYVV